MIHHITFDMLDRKFPKSNTIAMCQHYIMNLLDSDLSYVDRMTVLAYIKYHKERFTPLPTDTDDPITNEINRKINGSKVEFDFIYRYGNRS